MDGDLPAEASLSLAALAEKPSRRAPSCACRAGGLALAIACFAAEAALAATHALTVEDLLAVKQVSRVALSPDAKRVVIVSQGMDLAADVSRLNVYLGDARPGHELAPLPLEAAQAEWQADSQALTYLKPSGDCTQIWRIAVATRQAAQLGDACLPSKDRTLSASRWSADGRFLAYLAQPIAKDELAAYTARAVAVPEREGTQPCIDANSDDARAKGMDALDLACNGTSVGTGWMWGLEVASPALRFFWSVQAPLPPTELWVFEVATGSTRRIADAAADVRTFDWSTSGHTLAWFALARNAVKDEKAPYLGGSGSSLSFGGQGGIAWADAGSPAGAAATIAVGELSALELFGLGLRLAPDNSKVALGTGKGVRIFPTQPGAGRSGGKEVFSGRTVQFDWSTDSRSLYVLRYEKHVQSLVAVDVSSGRFLAATNDPRWHGKPSFSADHGSFALVVEDVVEPTRVFLGTSGSPKLREIVGHRSLNPHWEQVAPLVSGRIDWRSWDDQWDVYGVTVAPREAAKAVRPMVVVILGAGFPTQRQFGIDGQQPILLLAAAGYTVFIPNDRSRGGISPRGYEQLGVERTYFSKPWRDAMQGVDLMVAKGLADPARIGIMGNSYGGGLVGWGITQTTRFKAAILKEPVALDMAASWRSIWGHKGFGGDAIGKQYGIDNPYEGEGKKFIEYESPITNVSAVRTPTLLEFGVKSGSVQFGGNEFFQALTWFGVPAELVMYPRTIHGFVEPKLVADSFRRELRWFGQYLPPNPP